MSGALTRASGRSRGCSSLPGLRGSRESRSRRYAKLPAAASALLRRLRVRPGPGQPRRAARSAPQAPRPSPGPAPPRAKPPPAAPQQLWLGEKMGLKDPPCSMNALVFLHSPLAFLSPLFHLLEFSEYIFNFVYA